MAAQEDVGVNGRIGNERGPKKKGMNIEVQICTAFLTNVYPINI